VSWTITGAIDEFLAEAGEFLRADPARNTIILSVTDTLTNTARSPGADQPIFGWWRAEPGVVRAAFMHTPPSPAFLSSADSRAAADLAGRLAAAGRALNGINAEPQAADAFAAAWRDRTGEAAEVHTRMRLHRLDRLVPPDQAPGGAPRAAGDRDRRLLTEWFEAFDREIDNAAERDHAAVVGERLSRGGLTLWEVDDAPVSMAGVTPVIHRMARIAPVYTPPSRRGRGYAGALTAAVSRAALDAGATDVVLYTDLANPVSNSVYRRIGYRPVQDRLVLEFRRHALGFSGERT
jgi:predicted GNAT family acetyltransferase